MVLVLVLVVFSCVGVSGGNSGGVVVVVLVVVIVVDTIWVSTSNAF